MARELDVDLETLRLLVAISHKGSVNAAAKERGISQPAASARLREFEARWQVGVIQRSPRGSRLTADGEAVVAWAREVLHAADVMVASLHALRSQRQAGVVVAASLTVAEHLLPRWIAELRVTRPDIHPTLHVVNTQAVIEALRSHEADVGFIESTVLPADLERVTISRDRLVVAVARGHQWTRRKAPLTHRELTKSHWIVREPGSGTRTTFETALGQQPQVILEASSTTALIGAAAAGVGPAVVSALAVAPDLAAGRLRAIPTVLDLARPLSAVWRTGERLTPGAAELLRIAQTS